MSGETLSWSFGLRNAAGNYLTAETFGNRINCNASIMKKKQIFFLEQDASTGKVYIRTPQGKYLSTTAAGAFSGDGEGKGPNEAFEIEAQPDGRWALKGAHGYYAGGAGEKVDAFTKVIGQDRLWVVQLAMHPQCCIRNVNRKKYVHLEADTLNTSELIPWGEDAMLTLVFHNEGKYGLQASNGKYLSSTGALKDNADADTRFVIEFFSSQIAFKSHNGLYLTALGAKGTLKATKERIGLDELFVLEDSHPQLKLLANNKRRVSVRAGQEVTANQDDVTDAELFQVEIDTTTKLWSFRTHKNLFWTVQDDGSLTGSSQTRDARNWFNIEWLGDKIAIYSTYNNKYISTKKNGALAAIGASNSTAETNYVWELINRPTLILRGEYGFIGTLPSGVLECNKSTPEEYLMHITKGVAYISGSNGKYWKVNGDNITVNGSEPTPFFLELSDLSKLKIKFEGKYLQGFQNGGFKASGTQEDSSTLWEY